MMRFRVKKIGQEYRIEDTVDQEIMLTEADVGDLNRIEYILNKAYEFGLADGIEANKAAQSILDEVEDNYRRYY